MPLKELKWSLSRMDKSELEKLNAMGRSALHFAARWVVKYFLFCCFFFTAISNVKFFSIPGTAKSNLWSICLNVGWRLMLWGRKAWLLFIMFPGGFTDQYCCCSLCLMVFSLQICKNGIYPRWPGGWMFSQCEKLDPGPYSETKMWVDLWFLKNFVSRLCNCF